jgi:hypothetical protein
LRHASLCNVIKRIFGVVKRKFKILTVAPEFSIDTQTHLVLALLGLFNFIRMQEGIILLSDVTPSAGDEVPEATTVSQEGSDAIKAFRDRLAKEMWLQYCEYIGREP